LVHDLTVEQHRDGLEDACRPSTDVSMNASRSHKTALAEEVIGEACHVQHAQIRA
jgi:hypothetical protein